MRDHLCPAVLWKIFYLQRQSKASENNILDANMFSVKNFFTLSILRLATSMTFQLLTPLCSNASTERRAPYIYISTVPLVGSIVQIDGFFGSKATQIHEPHTQWTQLQPVCTCRTKHLCRQLNPLLRNAP
jgi:hypothetical protein